jgi:FixJ family two-component response regulator
LENLKVLFSTGYSAEIAGQAFKLRDGENFLQKPFLPAQLLETVRRCLDT